MICTFRTIKNNHLPTLNSVTACYNLFPQGNIHAPGSDARMTI